MRIEEAKILITGGSRGLGAALGRALARRGAEVVLVARGAEALEEVAADIRDQGGRAHALVGDLGEREEAERIAFAAAALVGDLDALIHNASTLGPVPLSPLAETEDADIEAAFATNLLGPFRLSRAIVPGMAARGRGAVLHISSDAAVEAYPSWGAYGASKAAFDHLAKIWAGELEGSGLTWLAIDPGEMDTVMHAEAMPEADPATLERPEQVAARITGLLEAALSGEAPESGARVSASELPLPASERPTTERPAPEQPTPERRAEP